MSYFTKSSTVKTHEFDFCLHFYPETERAKAMFCADKPKMNDYRGEFGSPAVFNNSLVGIMSLKRSGNYDFKDAYIDICKPDSESYILNKIKGEAANSATTIYTIASNLMQLSILIGLSLLL